MLACAPALAKTMVDPEDTDPAAAVQSMAVVPAPKPEKAKPKAKPAPEKAARAAPKRQAPPKVKS